MMPQMQGFGLSTNLGTQAPWAWSVSIYVKSAMIKEDIAQLQKVQLPGATAITTVGCNLSV